VNREKERGGVYQPPILFPLLFPHAASHYLNAWDLGAVLFYKVTTCFSNMRESVS